MTLSRRNFIAAATAGAALMNAHADPLGQPIGTQTWPIRDLLAKDFEGTLKQAKGSPFPTGGKRPLSQSLAVRPVPGSPTPQ